MICLRGCGAMSAVAVAILATVPVGGQQRRDDSVWRNPRNSVHVRVHSCGQSRCGTVVWANAKAKSDSARGGTPDLVGTELLRDFKEVSPKVWKGKVFVPDLNRVFIGTATIKDPNTLVARGCLLGNLGCKSQTWTQVALRMRSLANGVTNETDATKIRRYAAWLGEASRPSRH